MFIPAAVRSEHETLHRELAEATKAPGRIGEAARTLAAIMHPHFLREDEYAMPPLGLLVRLAQGTVSPDMAEALPLIARLKAELPLMLEEHRAIKGALLQLEQVAAAEGNDQYVEFAHRLMLHAEFEEEVLYPAAILVGEYLKLKLPAAAQAPTHP
jgi:hemerythrin HHE cation binding domain-containing protein